MVRQIGTSPRGERSIAPRGNSWEDYLESGEELLWQGGPDSRIAPSVGRVFISAFGAVFFSFSALWIGMALSINSGTIIDLIFPAFGLPFALIGLALIFGPWQGDAYVRKHTRYALTNKRGIIARTVFGRKMTSYPILKDSYVVLDRALGTVYFFEIPYKNNDGREGVRRIGFHQIPDAAEVYRIITDLQARLKGG